MSALDNLMQLCAECNKEIQHANNEKSMNRETEDTTRISECAIEINKDHSSQSQESRSPNIDCEDSYDDEDNRIDKESISCADECPSDFEEWLNKKKSRHKVRRKSYLD